MTGHVTAQELALLQGDPNGNTEVVRPSPAPNGITVMRWNSVFDRRNPPTAIADKLWGILDSHLDACSYCRGRVVNALMQGVTGDRRKWMHYHNVGKGS